MNLEATKVWQTLMQDPDLDKTRLASLHAHAKIRHYRQGDTIYQIGDNADTIAVILSGIIHEQVEYGSDRKMVVCAVRTGEMFGVHEYVSMSRHTTSAVAKTAVSLLRFDRADLRNLFGNAQGMPTGNHTLMALASYLARIAMRRAGTVNMLCMDVYGRINRLLATEMETANQFFLTHQEITGGYLQVNREHKSFRLLKQLPVRF